MSDIKPLGSIDLYKKSDRITAALFLVSNVISENEPLRTKIRSLGLDLINASVAFRNCSQYEKYKEFKLMEKNILQIISYLDVAFISGLISEMNSSIVKKELESLLSLVLNSLNSTSEVKSTLSREFFDGFEQNTSMEQIKDSVLPSNYIGQDNVFKVNGGLINGNGDDKLKRKDQRTRNILALISKKGFVSIKEISTYIKGCSEKTVQRELNLLIQEGAVKKTGERRWSRYSLANQ